MRKFSSLMAILVLFSSSLLWSQAVTQATIEAKLAEVTRLQNELQKAQAEAYQASVSNAEDLPQKQANVNKIQAQLSKAQDESYKAMQSYMQSQQGQQTQQVQQSQQPQQTQLQNSNMSANQQTTDSVGSSEVYFMVSNLIDKGLNENKFQIANLSPQLSSNQKTMLYTQHQKSAGGPFALNFFLGWGIGSYVQGDIGGGVFQSIADGFGLIMIIVGVSGDEISAGPIAVGCISYAVGSIYGWIRPFVFAKKYNTTLQEALNGQTMMFSVLPIIDPINEQYGVMARIKV